eukprot:CFRG5143T1
MLDGLIQSWIQSFKVLISAPILQECDSLTVFFWSEYSLQNAERSKLRSELPILQKRTAKALLRVIDECCQCPCDTEVGMQQVAHIQLQIMLSALNMNESFGDPSLSMSAKEVKETFTVCRDELSEFALRGAKDQFHSSRSCNCMIKPFLRNFCNAYRAYSCVYLTKSCLCEDLLVDEAMKALSSLMRNDVIVVDDIASFTPLLMVVLPRVLVMSACVNNDSVAQSLHFMLYHASSEGRSNANYFKKLADDVKLCIYQKYLHTHISDHPLLDLGYICGQSTNDNHDHGYFVNHLRLRICTLSHRMLQGNSDTAWNRVLYRACVGFGE